jgi:hypothetical protein
MIYGDGNKIVKRTVEFEDNLRGNFLYDGKVTKFRVSALGLPKDIDLKEKSHMCKIIGKTAKEVYILEFCV